MAKSQKRSNREAKKPKKAAVAAVVESTPMKGLMASASPAKKKK